MADVYIVVVLVVVVDVVVVLLNLNQVFVKHFRAQ